MCLRITAQVSTRKRAYVYHMLLVLGLGMGVLFMPVSCCQSFAAGNACFTAGNTNSSTSNTCFFVKSLWQLSSPSFRSLLNPGNILGLEKELTGLFLLNWRGEWVFRACSRENGWRFVFEDTVRLHLGGNEPDPANLVNELYISLNPADFFFIDLGKQVATTGAGYFFNPSDVWSRARERTPLLQDRELPPEGRVMLKGEYLFPGLTLEVGWAPRLEWPEDEDATLRKYYGTPQRSSPAWVKVSGGFSGVDGSCLFSYDRQWKAGLNLARVWGENLEIHAEIGWEEWEKAQVNKVNQLFRAITGDADDPGPYGDGDMPAIGATTEKGFVRALMGGNYTFTGGANLVIEYLFNGSGLTRKEWKRVLLSISGYATPVAGNENCPPVAAGLQKTAGFLAETGFPGLLRHYAMARFYKELPPALALEQIIIQNLVDWSGLAILSLSYEKERFILSFAMQIPYGKQKSEFGLMTEDWLLKLKVEWVR